MGTTTLGGEREGWGGQNITVPQTSLQPRILYMSFFANYHFVIFSTELSSFRLDSNRETAMLSRCIPIPWIVLSLLDLQTALSEATILKWSSIEIIWILAHVTQSLQNTKDTKTQNIGIIWLSVHATQSLQNTKNTKVTNDTKKTQNAGIIWLLTHATQSWQSIKSFCFWHVQPNACKNISSETKSSPIALSSARLQVELFRTARLKMITDFFLKSSSNIQREETSFPICKLEQTRLKPV